MGLYNKDLADPHSKAMTASDSISGQYTPACRRKT